MFEKRTMLIFGAGLAVALLLYFALLSSSSLKTFMLMSLHGDDARRAMLLSSIENGSDPAAWSLAPALLSGNKELKCLANVALSINEGENGGPRSDVVVAGIRTGDEFAKGHYSCWLFRTKLPFDMKMKLLAEVLEGAAFSDTVKSCALDGVWVCKDSLAPILPALDKLVVKKSLAGAAPASLARQCALIFGKAGDPGAPYLMDMAAKAKDPQLRELAIDQLSDMKLSDEALKTKVAKFLEDAEKETPAPPEGGLTPPPG